MTRSPTGPTLTGRRVSEETAASIKRMVRTMGLDSTVRQLHSSESVVLKAMDRMPLQERTADRIEAKVAELGQQKGTA